ncbi:MAG TPA: type II secretion system F family protein [Mycobacteriales bacterium]|nr:type II secretion system F family protein [Mycobacteriales bacterium]
MTLVVPALLAGLAVLVLIGPPVPRRNLLAAPPGAPRTAMGGPAAAAAVFGALVVPVGPAGAAVAGVLTLVALRAKREGTRRRARREERAGALEALQVLAAELRAGRSPSVALSRAGDVASGPTASALREAAGESALGEGAGAALSRFVDASAVPELLSSLAVCWDVCQGAGSSLALAVDRLEEALLADQACREEVEADLEGPRTSAMLLAVMPLFGLGMGAGLGGDPVHVLLRTPVGWGCLVIGVGLELLGLWWTGRIVRGAGGAE